MLNKIDSSDIQISGLSVVDPVGVVFTWKDRVFRAIQDEAYEHVSNLFSCGLIDELAEKHLFPNSWITNYVLDGYKLIIEHSKIEPVVYPFEWSYEMLKDAAIATLEVNQVAAKYGYQTKDAHHFNIIFDGATPLFIDLGSFMKIGPRQIGWVAADEFIRSFYYPLDIWSGGNSFIARRSIVGESSLPHESYLLYKYPLVRLARGRLLGRLARLAGLFQAGSVSDKQLYQDSVRGKVATFLFDKGESNIDSFQAGITRLRKRIQAIQQVMYPSQWGEYHSEFTADTESIKMTPRFERLIEIIKNLDVYRAVDLASNQGAFATMLTQYAGIEKVICLDYDENAIDQLYKRLKLSSRQNLVPVLQKIVFPFGIYYSESTEKRFSADLVVALAVTHHLILSQNIPLAKIFETLETYTSRYIVVEFMPLGLYNGKVKVQFPEWYNESWFKAGFEARFTTLLREQLEENRIVYVGEKLNNKEVFK